MIRLSCLLQPLTVFQVSDWKTLDLSSVPLFIGQTADELSVVCATDCVPAETLAREDGWRALRIEGVLEFSLVGILSRLTTVLAESGVGIFAISTYNTDYVLVKEENLPRAREALSRAGYAFID